jgi:endonuclease/exonuclease/phosphatase family metal-dependent hydrolase
MAGEITTRRRLAALVAWTAAAVAAGWALMRLLDLDVGVLAQLLAFTPYAAGGALVATAIAVVLRRWVPAVVAAVATAVLVACVLPRVLPDADRGPRDGVRLRVLTANLLKGGADPDRLTTVVRERGVDVLAVQEFTPEAAAALDARGVAGLLPYRHLVAEPGTTGSGLYSRFPVTGAGTRRNGGGFAQAYGTVTVPGAAPVVVESAHPAAPYAVSALDDWRSDLAAQPRADAGGPARILLGDFNSTLDHGLLRSLVDSGYRDAAEVTGAGLAGTWGPYDGDPIPPVTLDHVLADRRIGVRDAAVHDLPGSDHRPVYAELVLPASG